MIFFPYTLHVDTIRMLFPDAQFLMIVRDGRQVVHSLRNFVNPTLHEEACHTWVNYTTAGLRAADRLGPARMRVVRYERIVQDPTDELKEIHEFLDEPFEPATVDFIRNRPINSSFAGESSQDKLRDRWISWTAHERAIFMQVAGGLLVELGFVEDHAWSREPPTPSFASTQP